MTVALNFISVRIITEDVARLVAFYERLIGVPARWATEEFAELVTLQCTLAIGSTRTMQLFGGDIAVARANRSVICEFLVENVDAEYERVGSDAETVQEPTTMPWGQSISAAARPGRQSGQPVHPGDARGGRSIRTLRIVDPVGPGTKIKV